MQLCAATHHPLPPSWGCACNQHALDRYMAISCRSRAVDASRAVDQFSGMHSVPQIIVTFAILEVFIRLTFRMYGGYLATAKDLRLDFQ